MSHVAGQPASQSPMSPNQFVRMSNFQMIYKIEFIGQWMNAGALMDARPNSGDKSSEYRQQRADISYSVRVVMAIHQPFVIFHRTQATHTR